MRDFMVGNIAAGVVIIDGQSGTAGAARHLHVRLLPGREAPKKTS